MTTLTGGGTGLTDVFAGGPVQPSEVSYGKIDLGFADANCWWPFNVPYQGAFVLARLNDVTAGTSGRTLYLPPANVVGVGQDVFFNNPGAFAYNIGDYSGNIIGTVAPGQQKYFYLTSNNTPAGTWTIILFGATSGVLDAATIAGLGLKAMNDGTLSQASLTNTFSSTLNIQATSRGKFYVNTGGAVTVYLDSTNEYQVAPDLFFDIRNQGTGVVTITAAGGETIDGSTSITLQVNESCTVHAGVGSWYTVGRGRNTQFNFTQLLKTVTGGTTTLSITEASNVVQTYSGTATSNVIITLPAVVQVYYISNNVLGGFGFTIQAPGGGGGATLAIPYGQAAVVFCDGVNVINASTSVGGITALLLANGSVASPSMAIAAINNGFFAPTSTSIAVSAGGTQVAQFTGTGLNSAAVGATTPSTGAFTTLSATSANIATLNAPTTNITTLSVSGTATVPSLNSGQLAGMRNRVINGGMVLDSRSASPVTINSTTTGTSVITIDRWIAATTGATTPSCQVTRVITGTSNPRLKIVTTSIATGTITLATRIDAANCSDLYFKNIIASLAVQCDSAQSVSWSLWSAPSNDTWSNLVSVTSITNGAISIASGIWSATSVETAFNTGSVNTANGTTGLMLVITRNITSSGQYLQIGDAQIENGANATPFEQRPPGVEQVLAGTLIVPTSSAYSPFYSEGTYTGTITGDASGTSTCAMRYIKTGHQVTLEVPYFTITSNQATLNIAGAPSVIRPNTNRSGTLNVTDSGSGFFGYAYMSNVGVLWLSKDANASGFTASGTKGAGSFGFPNAQTFTYFMN